jgi:hypothetical protein
MARSSEKVSDSHWIVDAESEQSQAVWSSVQAIIRATHGMAVAFDESLMESGVNSMLAVQLSQDMSRHFSVRLTTTLVFDHPTNAELVAQIA